MLEAVQAEVNISSLILQVDDARAATDPFKLRASLRALVLERRDALTALDGVAESSDGSKLGASARVRVALDVLNKLLHDGYNFINGLMSFQITPADKRELFNTYGWTQGELGEFSDTRILSLARSALTVSPDLSDPARRYPPALLDQISAQLAIYGANRPLSETGNRETAVENRNAALALLERANSRVRYSYCQSSDDLDKTPELAKIGFQPRREPGEVASNAPKPSPNSAQPAPGP